MSDKRKLERWKKDILKAIEEVLDIENMKESENLTALALFRMLDLYYQDAGYKGIETIMKIWAYMEMQNKKKSEGDTDNTDDADEKKKSVN